jgi:hypothetical protein
LVHVLGLLTFFTLVWPNDPARRLVRNGGADSWFYAHLAQVVIFGLLTMFAFSHLASVCRGTTILWNGPGGVKAWPPQPTN